MRDPPPAQKQRHDAELIGESMSMYTSRNIFRESNNTDKDIKIFTRLETKNKDKRQKTRDKRRAEGLTCLSAPGFQKSSAKITAVAFVKVIPHPAEKR